MEAKILLTLPHDFNYKLSIRLAQLKRSGIKRTKADELLRLAQIGLLHESKELK